MKSTGIVRKVDHLGRIVVPKEIRRTLKIHDKDPLEIFVEGDRVVLRKYQPIKACAITGDVREDNIELEGGITLSPKGIEILNKQLQAIHS